MLRALAALAALVGAISTPALAHNMGGLRKLKPGMPFNLLTMRAVLPGPAGARLGAVDFNALRGSSLAFLVIDPYLPRDLAEARHFEAVARTLPNTRAFLVALPQRSQRTAQLVDFCTRERLGLPLLVDDRDIFPFAFGFDYTRSPRYELFDRSGTLILENPARLSQRLVTGLTVETALRQLDAGHPVEQATLSPRDDLPPRR
ncbi:MAG TPA: hypothetical protein VMB50_24190 [Myxococcales bacterium]|nr:hypothetical protein [Myxococcales bacterium]